MVTPPAAVESRPFAFRRAPCHIKLMKRKLLAMMLLAAGAVFSQISIGIRIGPPPPVRVLRVRPVAPGPGYFWVDGYWYPVGNHYKWHNGYWTLPPYPGARWVMPHHDGDRFFDGYWEGDRGRRDHDHHWDRDKHRRDKDRDDRDHDRGDRH